MFELTKIRSALDPTRSSVPDPAPALEDVTAGRAAGTTWNAAKDPTRAAAVDDPRR